MYFAQIVIISKKHLVIEGRRRDKKYHILILKNIVKNRYTSNVFI